MDIKLALNKIALHIILDEEISWQVNEFTKELDDEDDSLLKKSFISINGEAFQTIVEISRVFLEDIEEDLYSLDVSIYKDNNYIMCSNSALSMPHLNKGIEEVVSNCNICDFIALFETTNSSFYSTTNKYNAAFINYALNKENSVLQKKK